MITARLQHRAPKAARVAIAIPINSNHFGTFRPILMRFWDFQANSYAIGFAVR